MNRIVLGISIPEGMGGSAKFYSALHGIVLSACPDRAAACTAYIEVTQIRQLRKDQIWSWIRTTYGGNIVAVCFVSLALDTFNVFDYTQCRKRKWRGGAGAN